MIDPDLRSTGPRRGHGFLQSERAAVRPSGRWRRRLAAAVGLAASLGFAWWTWASPTFHQLEIEVEGTERTSRAWVEGALADLRSEHLLAVGWEEVSTRLEGHPWIESLALRKTLPNHLRVEIEERRPVALWRHAGRLVYVDADGEPIAPYDRRVGGGDLLQVHWEGPSPLPMGRVEALRAAIEATLPSWGSGLSEVEALGGDEYRLYTSALPYPVLVSGASATEALARWSRARGGIEKSLGIVIGEVDLRAHDRVVAAPRGPVSKSGNLSRTNWIEG